MLGLNLMDALLIILGLCYLGFHRVRERTRKILGITYVRKS